MITREQKIKELANSLEMYEKTLSEVEKRGKQTQAHMLQVEMANVFKSIMALREMSDQEFKKIYNDGINEYNHANSYTKEEKFNLSELVGEPMMDYGFLVSLPIELHVDPVDVEDISVSRLNSNRINVTIRERVGSRVLEHLIDYNGQEIKDLVIEHLDKEKKVVYTETFKGVRIFEFAESTLSYCSSEPHRFYVTFSYEKEEIKYLM